MLTIFTVPKKFIGNIDTIQCRAIESWKQLKPAPEIIVLGDEDGIKEKARTLGVTHISGLQYNEYGTPMLDSAFSIVQGLANDRIICYANTDILLSMDVGFIVKHGSDRDCLIVGGRYDDTGGELIVHPLCGIDYFIFTRGLYQNIPSLAIGRGGWDNWLIYEARRLGVLTIDASEVIMAIHQKHDYSHAKTDVRHGDERKRNLELIGGYKHIFTLEHCDYKLGKRGLYKPKTFRSMYFQIETFMVLHKQLNWMVSPLKKVVGIKYS